MQRSQSVPFPVVIAAALLTAALLMLGPATAKSKASSCGGDQPAYSMSNKEASKATLCLLNEERASRGMKPMHFDKKQQKAANRHNRVMIKQNCFSHQCPGEKDMVGRSAAAGYLPCTCTWGVAENLAWGEGGNASPQSVVDAWMGSSSHRANILNPKYDEIGIAVADGSPEGSGAASTYTADFGFKS